MSSTLTRALAAVALVGALTLSGCFVPPASQADQMGEQAPAEPAETPIAEGPAPAPTTSPTQQQPVSEPVGGASQARGRIFVVANSNTWEVDVLELSPAPLDQLEMFNGGGTAVTPPEGEQIMWLCFTATQTTGRPGAWVADDFRFQLWANGEEHDDLSAVAYQISDPARDVYYADDNPLGSPYTNVCTLFLVPADVSVYQIMLIPDDGAPVQVSV